MTLTADQRTLAACADHDPETWFPARGDNGAAARAVCATCPIRRPCLVGAVERSEAYGIWGGAGEPARRVLRRAWRIGEPAWSMALDAHFDALDAGEVSDVNGPGATHGRRGTYAKGCRCDPCTMAALFDGVQSAMTHRRPRRAA